MCVQTCTHMNHFSFELVKKIMGQKEYIGQKKPVGKLWSWRGVQIAPFLKQILCFARIYKEFMHFWWSIWAPSAERPGPGEP